MQKRIFFIEFLRLYFFVYQGFTVELNARWDVFLIVKHLQNVFLFMFFNCACEYNRATRKQYPRQ